MKIILFEDNSVQKLYPVTLTRPAFDILCGGLTLVQALKLVFPEASFDYFVRDNLKEVTSRNFTSSKVSDKEVLFINARFAPSITELDKIKSKTSEGGNFMLVKDENIVAIFAAELDVYVKFEYNNLQEYLKTFKFKSDEFSGDLLENLWDIIVCNQKFIKPNLQKIKGGNNFISSNQDVYLGASVMVEPQVFFDTADGPIVIDDGAVIKSMSVLRGPIYIGKNSIINSHSEIKHGACIGPVCKIGGEVETTVFQGYSNKQHSGFVGGSYVGAWVNLGGGTSNSDLKNTYSEIKMQDQPTGQKFLGCIIGDYSKAAINTSIFTGKVIGVNSLLYGTITKDVPSFTNAGSLLTKWVECPLESAYKMQSAVMARRNLEATSADKKLLQDTYSLTVIGRRHAKVKKNKLTFI